MIPFNEKNFICFVLVMLIMLTLLQISNTHKRKERMKPHWNYGIVVLAILQGEILLQMLNFFDSDHCIVKVHLGPLVGFGG
jgi:hypothetical protein